MKPSYRDALLQVSGEAAIGSAIDQYRSEVFTVNSLTYPSLSVNGGKFFLHMIPWNDMTASSLNVSSSVTL